MNQLYFINFGGQEGASFGALEIFLIKTWVTLQLLSKAHWKLHLYWKPRKQKKFLKIFCEAFWFE
jgi:hypothetical protein